VLGVLRRLDAASLVAASDSVCTGLQLVNFLQDVPRDLELGRIYLPAEDRRRFGDPALDAPSDDLRALLRFEADRAAALLRAGDELRSAIGGRLGRAVGLFARGGLAALDALEEAGWDIFTQRPKPSRARLAREAALVLVR
jgi:phytoene/squalene synthetase